MLQSFAIERNHDPSAFKPLSCLFHPLRVRLKGRLPNIETHLIYEKHSDSRVKAVLPAAPPTALRAAGDP
jgi:hypothetical protein